jgi:hypothetical protein
MQWHVVYYHGVAALPIEPQEGAFVHVRIDAASKAAEWTLS